MKLYALISDGHIESSMSPAFQNAAFRKLKMDAVYIHLKFNRAQFHAFMTTRMYELFEGLNITSPYKGTIIEYFKKAKNKKRKKLK